ncbi:MAG: DUF4268 domain-containing protein [Phycisphaerae bacterium]|nr:DUF4268 domain-containing protein [Phycisphaerae bacterium]
MNTLGRLERLELREVWQSEATAFTPWLAQSENLELLSEAIGLELECEALERNVGPFRADILCKDTSTGHWVLIENQLERTDHCHLGQLLTYASGLKAVTIVWIAGTFTSEHRAALDWLNEITDDRFSFFGLEVELWRIGNSPIAPKFNVVCKPNDWSKTVTDAAKKIDKDEMTGTQRMLLEFWTGFHEFLPTQRTKIKPQKPQAQNWMNVAIGRSEFVLICGAVPQKKLIRVALVCKGINAKQHFNLLLKERAEIESESACALDWRELPKKQESWIVLENQSEDPSEKSAWPRQYAWLLQKLEMLDRVFRKRVKDLDAEQFQDAELTVEESEAP